MKNISLIFPLLISFIFNAHAQTASTCRDIYVWDFQDNSGKKLSDNDATTDMEMALSSCSDCRVFEQKANSDLEVTKKNERLSSKSDRLSETLIKKLSEKGIKHILFGTVTEKNSDVDVDIKIFSSNTKNTVFSGVLTMNRNDFYGNRNKRRDVFKDFIINNILKKPSPVKLIVPIVVTLAGAGAVGYGLLQKGSVKSDWQAAFDKDPFDKANAYTGQNSKYKTNQYIAAGGGVVMAVGAFLLIKKIKERKKYNQSTGLTDALPKPKLMIEPLISTQNYNSLGIALRF